MKYRVIHPFADLQDKKHKYETGDLFPRRGLSVSEDRIKELSSTNNKVGISLIEEIEDVHEKKETENLVPKEPEKKTTKRKNKNAD